MAPSDGFLLGSYSVSVAVFSAHCQFVHSLSGMFVRRISMALLFGLLAFRLVLQIFRM
jgi:hypothetical protein